MPLSKKEDRILKSIVIPSENDPENPEFPPSPVTRLHFDGFTDLWIKDESKNPTGTHKDRMAWEIVVSYRDLLLEKKRSRKKYKLPSMSIISSGSAAIAIQSQLRKYELPALKVLVDQKLDPKLIHEMEGIGCEIHTTDLSLRPLNTHDILKLTHNLDGFDITSAEDPLLRERFYDWLSYEIINFSPEYCFLPFGTGALYENVLFISRRELSAKKHDPRFQGELTILKRCNFIGATTNDPHSKATKLYSPHLPFTHFNEQFIRYYRSSGFCGNRSDVHIVKEKSLDQALKVAEKAKILCEPSGIAGLALFLQMQKSIPKRARILILNTGKAKSL